MKINRSTRPTSNHCRSPLSWKRSSEMSDGEYVDLRVANLDYEHDAAAIERGLSGFDGLDTLKVCQGTSRRPV